MFLLRSLSAILILIEQIHINSTSSFGEYYCNATNNYGTTISKIILKPGTKPKTPQRILLRNVGINFLKFYVKNVGSKNLDMEIFGYRFEVLPKVDFSGGWDEARVYEFNRRTDCLYSLANLKDGTAYYIRVASRNIAGLSEWSKTSEYFTGTPSNFLAFTSRSHKLTSNLKIILLTLIPNCLIKILKKFI
jgi:hypothetical protein